MDDLKFGANDLRWSLAFGYALGAQRGNGAEYADDRRKARAFAEFICSRFGVNKYPVLEPAELDAAWTKWQLGGYARMKGCTAHGKADGYYGVMDPNSEGHCLDCHCSCNPDGPHCGHWAGCPGC